MLYPSFSGDKEPSVVFGPLAEAGYYRELRPNPVEVELLYEGLEGIEEPMSPETANRLFSRIERELVAGEMTPEAAELAIAQVKERLEETIEDSETE